MSPSLDVRRLSEDNARAYLSLRKRSLDGSVHPIEPQVRRELGAGPDGIATLLVEYIAEGTQVWGVFNDSVLTGVAALSRDCRVACGGIGVLWGIYVLPRYHGTPVSRLLMEAVTAGCVDSSMHQLVAPCARDNIAGLLFLRRFGFEPIDMPTGVGSIQGFGDGFAFLRRQL